MLDYKEEIYRKLIHFSSLWVPLLYLLNNTAFMVKILLPLAILSLIIEFVRKYSAKFNNLIKDLFGNLMRKDELSAHNFVGATHFFLSTLIVVLFFDKEIAILALTILVISDSAAALIGKKFGTFRMMGKSLEGTIAFLLSAFLVYYFYITYYNFELNLTQSTIAIIVGALFELFSKSLKLDDNFLVPLSIAIVLAL